MYSIDAFVAMLPTPVKVLLIILFLITLTSIVRSVRLAHRLYHSSCKPILLDDIFKRTVDPNVLALSALANRLPLNGIVQEAVKSEPTAASANSQDVLYVLQVSDGKFRYLWERSQADVESNRRAGVLVLLLSFVMVTFGAVPAYLFFYNNSNRTGLQSLLLAIDQLLTLLGLGLSLYTMHYFVSSRLERALATRMSTWKYFCTTLKSIVART